MCRCFNMYDDVMQYVMTFPSIALFNNRHFAVRIPKAHSTHLLIATARN